jgi:hypothetical protein
VLPWAVDDDVLPWAVDDDVLPWAVDDDVLPWAVDDDVLPYGALAQGAGGSLTGDFGAGPRLDDRGLTAAGDFGDSVALDGLCFFLDSLRGEPDLVRVP